MVAAFVVPGMTIIDGIVRTQRTRNTRPRARVPEIVGRQQSSTARAFISPDLRGEVDLSAARTRVREPPRAHFSVVLAEAAPHPTVFP